MESEYSAIMLGRSAFLFLDLVNLSLTEVGAVQVRNKVNPIRRVVTLLQEMAKKITEEGEQKAATYENLECYCETTSQKLKTNVKEGSARITDSTSKIQVEEGILVELETVIKVSKSRVLKSAGFLSSEFLRSCSFFDPEACIVPFGAIFRRRDVFIWERGVCVDTRSQ